MRDQENTRDKMPENALNLGDAVFINYRSGFLKKLQNHHPPNYIGQKLI